MYLPKPVVAILIIGLLVIVALGGALTYRFFFSGPEDTWLCESGQWVKHGNPSSPMPASGCGPTQTISNNPVTPTPTSTPSTSVTPAPSTDVSLGSNTRRFTSPALGITFDYLENQNGVTIATKEIQNKIYVYMTNTQPTTGQYAEVFSKNAGVSLEAAIKAKFLSGYSSADCLVKPSSSQKNYAATYEALQITVPVGPDDGLPELSVKWDKCPKVYTSTNGISYFLGENTHPEKYVYLSIGQYGINAPGNKMWQDTLKFLP